jgi:hypothetical protein
MKMTTFCSLQAYSHMKGIYMAIFLIFFTATCYAQKGNWELGVGIRPSTLKENPYSLMLKKYMSDKTAIRLGMSTIYDAKNKEISFGYSFLDSLNHSYSYNYVKKDKNFFANVFIGFQYGKKIKSTYFYGATDFSTAYKWEKSDPFPIPYNSKPLNMRPEQQVQIATIKNNKTWEFGIRQSFGFNCYITSTVSLSIEGGFVFNLNRANNFEQCLSYSTFDQNGLDRFSYGGSCTTDKIITWNREFNVSPLSLIILNYQF